MAIIKINQKITSIDKVMEKFEGLYTVDGKENYIAAMRNTEISSKSFTELRCLCCSVSWVSNS